MKDEILKAEEWVSENGFCSDCNNINSIEANREMINAFLAGIKAGKENAKEIIKDYMIIVKGGHITVCGVPEENRCINVLKLNEQAERFLKEIENV